MKFSLKIWIINLCLRKRKPEPMFLMPTIKNSFQTISTKQNLFLKSKFPLIN